MCWGRRPGSLPGQVWKREAVLLLLLLLLLGDGARTSPGATRLVHFQAQRADWLIDRLTDQSTDHVTTLLYLQKTKYTLFFLTVLRGSRAQNALVRSVCLPAGDQVHSVLPDSNGAPAGALALSPARLAATAQVRSLPAGAHSSVAAADPLRLLLLLSSSAVLVLQA